MRLLLILLAATSLVLGAVAADFATKSFNFDVTVSKDRRVTIIEDIEVTFTIPQHGLIRRIPFKFKRSDGSLRTVRYTLESVSLNKGAGYEVVPCSTSEEGRDWVLKIGERHSTLSGPVRYRIQYSVADSLTDFGSSHFLGDHAELFWNLLGTRWPTAIDAVSATIRFPEPAAGRFAFRAVVGPQGTDKGVKLDMIPGTKTTSRLAVATSGDAENPGFAMAVMTVVGPVAAGEALTIVLALPKGTLDPAPSSGAEEPVTAVDQGGTAIPTGVAGYFIPVFVLPALYWLARSRMIRPRGPRVTRFEPPDDVEPALCGYLIDQRVDSRDIVAGLISIAQKGGARIQSVDGSFQVHLLGTAHASGLTAFEQQLYAAIEPFGPTVDPELLKGNFGSSFAALSADLHRQAEQQGFIRPKSEGHGCVWVFGFLLGLATISAVCLLFSPIGTVIGFVAALIGGTVILTRMTNLLPKGAIAMGQINGLKEFISRAQADQMRLMLGRDPDQALFEELLPYAVAFGMADRWIRAFDGIQLSRPEWFDSGVGDVLWYATFADGFGTFDQSYGESIASASGWSEGSDFGEGSSGFDSGSWDSDGGGDAGDGGGGGGGDSW